MGELSDTVTGDRACCLCGGPGMKRRVQVLPWKMVCIYICQDCRPRMMEAILQVRASILGEDQPISEAGAHHDPSTSSL